MHLQLCFHLKLLRLVCLTTLKDVNDSKKLSEKKREHLFDVLNDFDGVDFGISIIESEEIDRINILQATHKAMSKSLNIA
ncbi:MAG: hypothetical protein ACJZ70_02345 [Limisphaerales bacterium]